MEGAQTVAESKVWLDDRLIPHIFADNTEDALYLQGYVEANLRLFQMDMISRGATGRLAEVLGPTGVEMDRTTLRKGMCLAASRAVKVWESQDSVMDYLNAYLRGVNDYINKLEVKDYPLEYKLLGFAPKPWTIDQVAGMYIYMCDVLAGKSTDLGNTNALQSLGRTAYDEVFRQLKYDDIPVIQKKISPVNLVKRVQMDTSAWGIAAINQEELSSSPDGIGSNNWVVTGSKSKTGLPILASDPHLRLSLPSIWVEMQIKTKDYNAYGVSLPGIPGIFIGFNEGVTWAETNASIDVSDLIQVQWKDNQRDLYLYEGDYIACEKIPFEIKVKGEPSIIDTTHLTKYGPIKYYSKDAKTDLALQWIVLDDKKSYDVSLFARIMQSKSVDDLNAKLVSYSAPAQNILTADRNGNISLRVMGYIPARDQNDGLFVEKGNGEGNLWSDYIPFEDMPADKNPASDYLTSSNQRSISIDYPYFLNGNFEKFRNLRIHEELDQSRSFTVKDMKKLQADDVSSKAKNTLPLILKYSTGRFEVYDSLLGAWDYSYDKDEFAPFIFNRIYESIWKNTFDELYAHPERRNAMPDERSLEVLLQNPKHPIFDLQSSPHRETAEDIVNQSIHDVIKEWGTTNLPVYGKSRNVKIAHLLRIPAFSVESLNIGGNEDCIDAQNTEWGPSWRMVVAMGPEIEAWGVYPGGQSGSPASTFYKDFVETWSQKDYFRIRFMKSLEDIPEEESSNIIQINKR